MPAGDTRTVWMGWIGNWQYANKEPTVLWRGAQSIPRELHLRNIAGQLRMVQIPVAETEHLRDKKLLEASSLTVADANQRLKKAAVHGDLLEVEIEFQPSATGTMGVKLRKGSQQETLVGFSQADSTAFIDRTRSGESSFASEFLGRHSASVLDASKRNLRIFLDRSSVESFVNYGDLALTDRIYPSAESDGVELFSDAAGAKVLSLRIWSLRSVWQEHSTHE
jgi:sucrose-6-phosphate hydrolase SacC (GH32 family)